MILQYPTWRNESDTPYFSMFALYKSASEIAIQLIEIQKLSH